MFLETKEVSRVFKESVKCVSRKLHKNVSRVFQGGFNEVKEAKEAKKAKKTNKAKKQQKMQKVQK